MRLYVGNLPYTANEEEIRAAFGENGRNVTDVHIVTDRETGRPRGFAFVEMASEGEAEEAISAWDGQDFGGRDLTVNHAKPRANSGGGGGGRRDRNW